MLGINHRGYEAHMEHGVIVWYRSTTSISLGVSKDSGKEIRHPTSIQRIVTSTPDIDEATKQLDRRLTPPKRNVDKPDPDQMDMFK